MSTKPLKLTKVAIFRFNKKWRMPILRHTFFGHNSAIFGPIGLTFFYGNSIGDYYFSIDGEKSKI